MVLVTKAFNKDFGRTFNNSMPHAKSASLSQARAAEKCDRSLLSEATSNLIKPFLFSFRSARGFLEDVSFAALVYLFKVLRAGCERGILTHEDKGTPICLMLLMLLLYLRISGDGICDVSDWLEIRNLSPGRIAGACGVGSISPHWEMVRVEVCEL